MTALDRLFGRALGGRTRRLSPARMAVGAVGALIVVAGAAALLQRPTAAEPSGAGALAPSGVPGSVAVGASAAPTPETPTPETPTPTPLSDFWDILSPLRDPRDRSLVDLGERSEAAVVGSFTGEAT